MLPPITSPIPTTSPTPVVVAPRPATQEPGNGRVRNITARAVDANDEADAAEEDNEHARNQRVEGKRQSSAFRRSFGFLGQYVDLLV
ncbi:hypothetical protein GCM10017083_00700 [Thalassobaculum fulvum]|jgi:hypothetical protein|uniref:Uncharacterized protein n=1 Tax=Thalassobaculum fulvum TaxID=1633335 RepID=A0A918XMP1_9PROT|nr:hypothetical protein [Thalassobaculum fulvum]GHD39162.1 hypothetical protein GCM10017083_00700 [Thalassobaculum fulvum]